MSTTPVLPIEEVKSARLFWALTLTLAVIPAFGIARAIYSYTARGSDVAVTTLALFAGSAWHIWRFLGVAHSRRRSGAYWAGLVILCWTTWQMSWISADDFWFFRVGLMATAVGWLLVIWDWPGLVHGWRILVSFAVWAVWCDGKLTVDMPRFTQWLSIVSAKTAALVLWVAGDPARVTGRVVAMRGLSVSVGLPCTAIPLVVLLWVLLAIAGLLMRLRFTTLVRLAAEAAVYGYAISIVRIIVLLEVVDRPERFTYWHYGPGSSWFTAAGLFVLAWRLVRTGGRLPVRSEPYPSREHIERRLAWAWLAVLVCGAAGWLLPMRPLKAPSFDRVPAIKGLDLVSDRAPEPGSGGSNRFSTRRASTYFDEVHGGRVDVAAAFVPVMLTGDPREIQDAAQVLPMDRSWTLRRSMGTGDVWESQSNGRVVWLTTIRPDGRAVATRAAWHAWLGANTRSVRRWAAWFAHRAPLRDKRACWVALAYTGDRQYAPSTLTPVLESWAGVFGSR